MKDKYLYWKRLEEQLKTDIEGAEASLYINRKLLSVAKRHLDILPKPKPPKPPKVASGTS